MTAVASDKSAHVDLHMHSTLSDGALSVRELIAYCRQQGVGAMAVTDHDNIDAYEEGRAYAEEAGIEYVPGVEISSHDGESDVHILGYLYEPTHLRLNRTLVEQRERRRARAQEILRRLALKGMELSYDKLEKRAHGSLGRAHIAAALVEEEYVPSFQEAFNRYLGNGTEVMEGVDGGKPTPGEAIRLIREAGGVPVMAHPGKTRRDDLIESMVECGLQGIEVYCHSHSASGFRKYRDLARRYGLACCGGADFHARSEDGRHAPGSLNIPYAALGELKDLQGGR